jgi:hypothetical protein
MKARILITLTTLIASICIVPAGKLPPSSTFNGVWAGFNGPHGPGATGGTLTFSVATDLTATAAISANATPITGSVRVPNLHNGGFQTFAVTGYITPKGRIRAKFKGGYFNGHLDRGEHGAAGFLLVNVHKYQAVSFWFADQDQVKSAE